MSQNLFQVWSGKEQDRGMMAQLLVFACPSPVNNLSEEVFFSKAVKEGKTSMTMIQPSRKHEAAPGKIEEFGTWWSCVANVPDQEIIKIVGTRKGGSFGSRQDRAAIFLQSREKAAHRKITFALTGSPIMARADVSLEGRFDILTEEMVQEIDAKLITPWARGDILESKVARVFRTEVIQHELEPRPVIRTRTVVNAQGRAVGVQVPQRRRRIKV